MSLINRVLNKLAREIIYFLIKCKNNRILLMHESSSGSNTYALLKFATDIDNKKYEIISFYDSEPKTLIEFIRKHKLLASAKLIITTHASYKPSKKNIHLQLWHGPFIKKNGVMVQDRFKKDLFGRRSSWRKVDHILSYSETYTTFFNACMVTDPDKYVITGAPRNDFLFSSDGKSHVNKIFSKKTEGFKTILFLPTFRQNNNRHGSSADKLFGFDKFSLENFDKFLEKNNCKLIFKPHPHQEEDALSYLNNYHLNNLLVLKEDDLLSNQFDLYELLNASEILITDYSSVFYDFLLLDRQIIFIPTDIDLYKEERGFVIESYDRWTPGPKVTSQDHLENEISKSLANNSYFSEERKWVRELNHRYNDGDSSRRLWKFIDTIMPHEKF